MIWGGVICSDPALKPRKYNCRFSKTYSQYIFSSFFPKYFEIRKRKLGLMNKMNIWSAQHKEISSWYLSKKLMHLQYFMFDYMFESTTTLNLMTTLKNWTVSEKKTCSFILTRLCLFVDALTTFWGLPIYKITWMRTMLI